MRGGVRIGRQKALLWTVLVAMGLLGAATARARAEAESPYTLQQTYSGALRYLRVDLGYEVVERDPDAAYLLFRYEPGGESNRVVDGSIELVKRKATIRVFVRIPTMPSYHEGMLRDGLMKKLTDDYGEPPSARKREDSNPAKSPQEKAPEGDDREPAPPGNEENSRTSRGADHAVLISAIPLGSTNHPTPALR